MRSFFLGCYIVKFNVNTPYTFVYGIECALVLVIFGG